MQLRATRLSAISNAVRSGFRGALDGLSDATKAALVHLSGGRRLLKTYPKDGALMQVRRSTDNAALDIGALKSGWIDAATAASFAGAGDLFAVTGYDQRVTSIEQRRNLLTYSEQIDNPVWSKSGSTITANAGSAPDGTTTADKLLENTATSPHFTLQNLAISGVGTYTVSVYAKAVERSSLRIWLLNATTADRVQAVYDLSTGTLVSSSAAGGAPFVLVGATIQALADGWYRLSLTGTTTGGAISLQGRILLQNASGSDNYLGDGTSGLLVWGAQIERSATATTYQRVDAGTEFPKRFVGAVVDSHELTQSTATAQPRLTVLPQEEAPIYEWSAANGTDGWVGASGATVSVVDGKLRVTDVPSGAAGRAVKSIPTVVGKAYRVFVNPTAGSAGLGLVRASVNEAYGTNIGGLDGTNDFVFTATTTSTNILLIAGADDGRWCEWDTVRVTPAYTEGNRITLSSMTELGTCVVNDSAGTITFAQSNDVFSGAVMVMSNIMDEGALYEISIDCLSYANGRFQLYTEQATAGIGINVYTSTIQAVGTYRFYVRMSSAQQRIVIARQGGVTTAHNATFGNFICRKIIGSRRNLLTHSAQIGNAVWTKAGASVPAGSNVLVESSGADTQHRLTRSVTMVTDLSTPSTANKTFGIQAKVKRVTGSRHFQIGLTLNNNTARLYYDLDAGTVAAVSGSIAPSGTIELLPTGEWLCKATATGASTSSANMFLAMTNTPTINAETYTGDGVSSLQITDIQYEIGEPSAYQMVGANVAAGVLCYEPSKKHVASWNFDGASDYFERPASDFPANLHTLPTAGPSFITGDSSNFDGGLGGWFQGGSQGTLTAAVGVAQITGVNDYVGKALYNLGGMLGKSIVVELDVWSNFGSANLFLQRPDAPFTNYVASIHASTTPRRVQLFLPSCPVPNILVAITPWSGNTTQVVYFDNVTAREIAPDARAGLTVAMRIDPLTNTVGALWSMRDNSIGFVTISRLASGAIQLEHRSDANIVRTGASTATVAVGASATIVARWNFATGTASIRINGTQQTLLTAMDIAGGLTARRHLVGASRPGATVTGFFTGFISEPIIINAHTTDAECAIIENALKEGLK